MFVTRRAYDDAQRTIARLLDELATERGRYTVLVGQMNALQRMGFRAPEPPPAAPEPAPRLPAPVLAAITTTMSPRGEAARHVAELAQAWLDEGESVETVCSRIRQGAEGVPHDHPAD